MNRAFRFAAPVLALLIVLSAGCGRNTPQPDYPTERSLATTQAGVSDTEAEPSSAPSVSGFAYEDVVRENAVSTLVGAYRNVQMLRYEGDALYSEMYFFEHNGEPVWTMRSVDPDFGESYSCGVREVGYHKEGDHLQFSYDLNGEAESPDGYTFDFSIAANLPDGEVRNIESAGEDLWRFEIRDDALSPDVVCRCTATKQTLTLKTIEWDYGDGTGSKIELRHGDAVRPKDFGLLDGFDKPLRTVKCVCTLHDSKGNPTETTYSVEVPYNAEPLWVCADVLNVYLDKGLTEEYVYPGNGDGYTVYATDAMG